jgi:hypothetical protein
VLLQVCWDFYNASKHGLAVLEAQAAGLTMRPQDAAAISCKPASVKCSYKTLQQLSALPAAGGWSWQQWAAFLQDPLQYKVPQLKQAAKQLGLPGNRIKAELLVSILQAFGLQEPSRVSPQLLRAVLLERCCSCPWVGCQVVAAAWRALNSLGSSEVDRKWPGLGDKVLDCKIASAAARRKVLQMHFGDCSKQQLKQLQEEVQQLKVGLNERNRNTVA